MTVDHCRSAYWSSSDADGGRRTPNMVIATNPATHTDTTATHEDIALDGLTGHPQVCGNEFVVDARTATNRTYAVGTTHASAAPPIGREVRQAEVADKVQPKGMTKTTGTGASAFPLGLGRCNSYVPHKNPTIPSRTRPTIERPT